MCLLFVGSFQDGAVLSSCGQDPALVSPAQGAGFGPGRTHRPVSRVLGVGGSGSSGGGPVAVG
jgi:hypothetical protein